MVNSSQIDSNSVAESASGAELTASQTDATKSKRGWKRFLLRGLIVSGLLLAAAPCVTYAMARFLSIENSPTDAKIAIPLGGDDTYLWTARWAERGENRAALFDFQPNRIIQRQLSPTHRQAMLQRYADLGLSPDQLFDLHGPYDGFSELFDELDTRLTSNPSDDFVIVCNLYSSRLLKSRLDRQLSADNRNKTDLVTVDPYEFSAWNWPASAVGRRTVVTEWVNYLAFLIANEQQDLQWITRSPQELKNAAVAAGVDE